MCQKINHKLSLDTVMIPWLPTRLHTPSSPSWCAYSCEQWWGLKPHSTPCGNAWSMNHPKALRKPHATKNKDKNYLCFHHPQCTSTSPLGYLKSHEKPLWVKGDIQKSSSDFESTSSMWNVKYLSRVTKYFYEWRLFHARNRKIKLLTF
jgi:hypothetical protein